jgi:peptidoglycan/LPS O-acetylase OafA/YrhL
MTETTAVQALRPEKVHALTSLRFFAALFVVGYHVVWSFLPWVTHQSLAGRVVALGYVSVSFFFLLSGYILGVVYLRRGGPVAVKDFYRARFARVYPLFVLTLALDTPSLLLSRIATYGLKSALLKTAGTFLGNLLMLHAWFLQLRGIDNPNWSLSVETLFYLTFPFLGVLLWKLRGARLWLMAALLYVGGQALVFVAARLIKGETTEFLPWLHLTTFALGILLARWQMLGREGQAKLSRSPGAWPWAVAGLALAGFAAVVYWSPGYTTPLLCDGMLAPIFAALIWAFSHSDWLPARVMSASWLVVLGEASFGLYLFHIPVYHLFERLGWINTPQLLPVYLGLSIGLSLASFYWFETPVRKRILRRKQAHVKESIEVAADLQ